MWSLIVSFNAKLDTCIPKDELKVSRFGCPWKCYFTFLKRNELLAKKCSCLAKPPKTWGVRWIGLTCAPTKQPTKSWYRISPLHKRDLTSHIKKMKQIYDIYCSITLTLDRVCSLRVDLGNIRPRYSPTTGEVGVDNCPPLKILFIERLLNRKTLNIKHAINPSPQSRLD